MGTFSETIEDILFTNNEWNIIEKYRSLDDPGRSHVDSVLDWEAERVKQLLDTQGQLRQSQSQVDSLKLQLSQAQSLKQTDN